MCTGCKGSARGVQGECKGEVLCAQLVLVRARVRVRARARARSTARGG